MRRDVLLAAVAVAVLALGCMSERDAINRVQANAMAKSFFVGPDLTDIEDDPEFYMRGTVIDVGYGASQDGLFTSTYAQPVGRVKWEITENYLNARLAYERIPGSDSKGNIFDGLTKKTTNDGQVVASYRIRSHFDIKRSYNPSTGEPLNVIEENQSDRPWYEREYFRVDWSSNTMTDAYDFDTLSMLGIYGGVTYEPVSFDIQDPNDANAPHFDMENGYFDVTTKAFAKPGMVDLSSYGWGIDKFPACFLPPEFGGGTWPVGNCNPVELTIRQAFKRVVDNDYQPVHQDGVRFNAFGAFNFSYRMGYERNYGMVDDRWFRFQAKYNLWERSHYYEDVENLTGEIPCATYETSVLPTGDSDADANRDFDMNGTADECEQVSALTGLGGSQCDVFRARCTLPYALRVPKTIVWYVNGNTEEDLFEATMWATQEWNVSLKTAVQTARLVECRRTGGGAPCDEFFPMWTGQQDDYMDAVNLEREYEFCQRQAGWDSPDCAGVVDGLAAQIAAERGNPSDPNVWAIQQVVKMPHMLVLCHNPVIESDHPLCGPVGLTTRQGDLRYNTVLHIDKPQSPSAWGIMVDADDPITGEKVAASINIWTHITDLAVQQLIDQILYMNGEIQTSDITNGDHVRNWSRANALTAGAMGPTMSSETLATRLAAVTSLDPATFSEHTKVPLPAQVSRQVREIRNEVLDVAAHVDVPSSAMATAASRMQRVRGSEVEAELLNPAIMQLGGLKGDIAATGTTLEAVSPLALNNPRITAQIRRMRQNALAKRGACILEAPEPSGLTGVADIMRRKFPRADNENSDMQQQRWNAMHRYLKRRYHYSVIIHEMGHSVGHRHNFVSSFGALFFRPQYWQLRTRNGSVNSQCLEAAGDGSSCIGPRYFDPVTAEEQDQLIWMFMQSSIMDYAGDISQDTIGLGIWAFAATRAFYGDTVAIYKDPAVAAGTRAGVGLTNTTDTFGGLAGIKYSAGGGTEPLDLHYTQIQAEYGVISGCYPITPRPPSWWDFGKDGNWDPVLDGNIVAIDGNYTRCRNMPVDYVAWNDLRQPTEAEVGGGYYMGGPSVYDSSDGVSRLRVPYHFATDHWADLGNVAVFRHDNGADPYEQAQFLINTQENRHILDNFRRNRTTFNVRSSANRSFGRYNEKLVNLAGGMAFLRRIYERFAPNTGYTFDSLWPFIVASYYKDHVVAATVAFDHLSRQISRPEDGEHYKLEPGFDDSVLRSMRAPEGSTYGAVPLVVVPNGTTGYIRDVGFGGHPIENAYSEGNGDYDTDYTMNAGSYYDKIYAWIHLSISEDRFVSQSRDDFYDARFRANGLADLFPEGYRRLVANALTGDRWVLAPLLAADGAGNPLLDATADTTRDPLAAMYPSRPMGWVSWWPKDGPAACFATMGRNVCTSFDGSQNFHPDYPANTVRVDPQVGWEVQKFVIAYVLSYIPANWQSDWIDMMKIYRLGPEATPEFENRIEWKDPISGDVYYARTYGKECLFGFGGACDGGRLVQKGIAARVLEYANDMTAQGYKLDTTTCGATLNYPAGYTQYGRPCIVRQPNGQPVIKSDPALCALTQGGRQCVVLPTCDQNIDPACTPLTIMDNHWAYELKQYKSVPDYLWESLVTFGFGSPDELGLY